MPKPIDPSIPGKFLLSPAVIAARNRVNPAFPTRRVKVCLVNLVARQYAGKQQPPVAAQTLAAYLKATTQAQLYVIDMQQHLISLEREILQEGRRYLTIDERFEIATQRIINEIQQISPHILGLSMKRGTLKPAEQIVQACKGSLVVVGNTIPTFGSDELLAHDSFRGAVAVLGEGEEALRTIIEVASENLDDCVNRRLYHGIPNVKTEPHEVIERKNIDLSIYPVLTHEEFFGEGMLWATLEASRGCAWSFCTFCSIGGLYASPQWRSLPNELTLDRIERFVRAGYHEILFADSNALGISAITSEDDLSQRIRRMETIAGGITDLNEHYAKHGAIGEKDRIRIARLSARIDSISKQGEADRNTRKRQLYGLLKEKAGLGYVYLGIESGNQRQLSRYGKGIRVEENREAVKILREMGIWVQPGFMFFDPLQTLAEARENIELIFKDNFFWGRGVYGSLRVQAGSQMVEILAKKGLLTGDFDLDNVSHHILWKGEIGEIRKAFEEFSALTRELIDYLEYMEDNSDFIAQLGVSLHNINGEFLKSLLHPKITPELQKKWLANYLRNLRDNLLLELKKYFRMGSSREPTIENEILPATLKRCQELITKLEAQGFTA